MHIEWPAVVVAVAVAVVLSGYLPLMCSSACYSRAGSTKKSKVVSQGSVVRRKGGSPSEEVYKQQTESVSKLKMSIQSKARSQVAKYK